MLDARQPLVDAEVSVLQWPKEEPLRRQLASFHLPRLLVVAPGGPPPGVLDDLEDWMRLPAEAVDLRVRARVLRDRARAIERPSPILDDDGILRVGASWVALTTSQMPVVQVLLEQLGRVVRTEAIIEAHESVGGSGHPASVRTLLSRIGARVAPLGLELVMIRQRGVVLSAHPQASPRPRSGLQGRLH